MNLRVTLSIVLCYLLDALGAPIELTAEVILLAKHEETGGFYEGDMELEVQRNGLIAESKRWPNNTVYYKINGYFDTPHVDYILRGMQMIENVSCIRFQPAPQADAVKTAYVNINGESTGCHSHVGYRAQLQRVNLQIDPIGSGCFRLGTIVHEFLHTLGFHHQQSTWNRDEYVTIVANNIQEGKEVNFQKRNESIVSDFNTAYDYGSVLHYSSKAFSKNGRDTIIALQNTGTLMGQRAGMSSTDIRKLNLMYKCVKGV